MISAMALVVLFVCSILACRYLMVGRWGGQPKLVLDNTLGVYVLLGSLYYVVPLLQVDAEALGNLAILPYSMAVGLAFLSLTSGYLIVTRDLFGFKASLFQQTSLQLRCSILVVLLSSLGIAYYYYWRISAGIFFNQARYYEQDTTLEASFRDVFLGSLSIPLTLLAINVGDRLESRGSRYFALFRNIIPLAISLSYVLSSQMRPALSVLLFWMASSRSVKINASRLVLASGLAVFSVIAVWAIRLESNDDIVFAENQLSAVVAQLPAALAATVFINSGEMADKIATRSSGGIVFFDEIYAATAQTGHLYGETIVRSLEASIPRVLWPDKGVVVSGQVAIQQSLGLFNRDAPVTPLVQFYVEAGFVGVALGHMVLGLLLGAIRWMYSKNIYGFIVSGCLWGALCQVESEVILGVINALRLAGVLVLILVLARVVLSFVSRRSKLDVAV